VVVVNQYSLFYTVSKDFIKIILFWDNRRNPEILSILLKEIS